MTNNTIDGNTLKKLITNGALKLRKNYKIIDELNVFPVPDGDTGSNMQSTMIAGVTDIKDIEEENIYIIARKLAKGLLMGARGNSGVILSQLWSGFANGFKDIALATAKDLANAFESGVEQAYSAVINPVEGTILTVAKDASRVSLEKVTDKTTIKEILEIYIEEANASLERTPDILQVLKEAGVVDSGGAGYLLVIEGMLDYINGIKYDEGHMYSTTKTIGAELTAFDDTANFGYCTEFIVMLREPQKFNQSKIIKKLSNMGDSIVVVQDEEILKVHIHTKTPGDALNVAQVFGQFMNIKIENMNFQHSDTVLHTEAEGGDCDCGHDHGHYHKADVTKKYGIITVVNGDGLKQTFTDMGADYIIAGGQTMNPSTEDFVNAAKSVNAENIFIIPNNKNVFLSAQTAADLIEDKNVIVVPAKTIAQGYVCLTMFDSNQSIDDNVSEMKQLIEAVKTGEITYAVRDTKIKGIEISKGDYMGIADGKITISNSDRSKTFKSLIDNLVDSDTEIITVMYGEGVKDTEINEFKKYITDTKKVEVELINGGQDIYSFIIAVE